ncbi:hypothetical protein FT663_02876 [Candidozyma haemuli var. vulneris]|uniref:Zn(2)-C6 fungal-type domain-containing protein n=1 Tax=Candidozyma haemuli TaxID=45357 RepID=A0A2V1AX07_9ASCO|nr:hypothetical protein CXQ85_005337 [[Candida] haemuloni]KAF3989568.1 hypothetical protein FT662_02738 [[Candida] haemuloni var. vulneris]KAF3991149.1 hypothetical protein FT663_02876 [[Candida] haemuloni var. vulneris]PVH22309.1 hypothetical protein CXQ85_005337 [[Candida] haemuloni]
MCSEPLNYKAYQQVLNLGCEKKTKATKMREPKPTSSKRRTKTGCMTCRRRKKKCDEHKTGGKCQACIRNFLDCHWPGDNEEVKSEENTSSEVSVPASPETPKSLPVSDKGADAYPSPVMSPKSETAEEPTTNCMDIKCLTLPPIKGKTAKVTKPETKKKSQPKKAQEAKFFIASFDSGKSLCQIKS